MEKIINILLLDKSNNISEQISSKRPNTFNELKLIIINNIKNLPNNYNIYYKSELDEEIIINNNEEYMLAKSKIFIKEMNDLSCSTDSLFSSNYKRLSYSEQEELDDKYNCNVCDIIIKNEKPLLCYQCQKIFHKKCLEDWNNKCQELIINFNCPKCKFEMPLIDWKEKINYTGEREKEAEILEKLYKLKNIDKINNNKYDKLNKEYNKFKENSNDIFEKIINKIFAIKKLLENNIINQIYNINYNNLKEISNYILEELENIEAKIKIKFNNINENNIINNYYLNKNYIKFQDKEKLEEQNFSIFNNLDTEFNQQKNVIKTDFNNSINYNNNNILINQISGIKNEIKQESNNNINKKNEKLIPPINEIKNEINCIYIPNYREENEINLLHDYNLNKDEIPFDSTNTVELYTKNKNTLPIFFKQYTEVFINNIKHNFSFKYKVKKSEEIIVKFKFKKELNDISFMFCNCHSLISIDLNNFYSNELVNICGTFYNCSSLKNINISKFNACKINNMSYLFYNCNSLEFLDLKSFNTNNVKDMSSMFAYCYSIKNINLSSFNTHNLEFMDKIFYDCKSLISLDISSFDSTKVKNISGLFDSCYSLKKKYIKIRKDDKKILNELNKIQLK